MSKMEIGDLYIRDGTYCLKIDFWEATIKLIDNWATSDEPIHCLFEGSLAQLAELIRQHEELSQKVEL